MTKLDTYQENAAQRAQSAPLRELIVSLDTFARDIETEGRTMAPAFMREATKRLEAMARRDWAVRVLDAWGLLGRQTEETRTVKVRYSGTYKDTSVICARHAQPAYNCPAVKGDADPDAARLAAAEAVLGELPEAVRQDLGEKP